MRLHVSNEVTKAKVRKAAERAGAWFAVLSEHGSRKADHAFEVKLLGTSNRRPNGGSYGASNDYAATWDQWGVFLSALFEIDPNMSSYAYRDAHDFDEKTDYRFEVGWPTDAHGDHTFRFKGVIGEQGCTKCSAVQRWNMGAA